MEEINSVSLIVINLNRSNLSVLYLWNYQIALKKIFLHETPAKNRRTRYVTTAQYCFHT